MPPDQPLLAGIGGMDDAPPPPSLMGPSVVAFAAPTSPMPLSAPAPSPVMQRISGQRAVKPATTSLTVGRARAFPLTGPEQLWYALQCIACGAGYLAKVPMKKALSDAGLAEMTSWERIWYFVQCIAFGSGYFTKVVIKKALGEAGLVERTGAEQFWYVLQCIFFGAGYFAKVPMKKALRDIHLAHMTDFSQFWYVLQCVFLGSGYLAKVPMKKALSEMPHLPQAQRAA